MPKRSMGKVSPQTQRLILNVAYDYEEWTGINTAQASNLLGMPHATTLRAFDELAAIDHEWITATHNVRWFHPGASKKAFLQKASPFLSSPVLREYRLNRIPRDRHLPLGGTSAISHHASSPAPLFPTYAVTKEQERELGLREGRGLAGWGQWDAPACIVQVMRYDLDSMAADAIDPLSAILSLSEGELQDPRIEDAAMEILKRIFAGG